MRYFMAHAYPARTLTACMVIALGMAIAFGNVDAATLGRLFYTPAQRAKLDQLRNAQRGTLAKAEAEAPEHAVPEPTHTPQPVTLNGVVRRSDGSTTIWINEQMHQTGSHSSAKAADSNGVDVVLPESKRKVRLKVGQTVDPVSGAVKEREMQQERAGASDATVPRANKPAAVQPDP